jgi:hypothetical protein
MLIVPIDILTNHHFHFLFISILSKLLAKKVLAHFSLNNSFCKVDTQCVTDCFKNASHHLYTLQ